MKLLQLVSRLDMILRHSKMSKDSRISFPFLMDLIHAYRAVHVRESYNANMEYDTSLFQYLGMVENTPRSLQDDPWFPRDCTNLGKASVPSIVSLVNNAGLVSVSSPARNRNFNPCGITELVDRMHLENYKNEWWFAKVANTIWTTPYMPEISVTAILDNPMEGWILNTQKPVNGQLVYRTEYNTGEFYKVISGTIVHDGIQYGINSVFEATLPGWTGNGTIEHVNKKRRPTIDDEYPMSATMTEIVMMKILTQEFKLEKQEIADVRNNLKDDTQVMIDA